MKADCDVNPSLWVPASMPGWNADWTTGALMTVPSIDIGGNRSDGQSKEGRGGHEDLELRGGSQGVTCDEWVDHPVLIVQRDTFANFFHDRSAVLCFKLLHFALIRSDLLCFLLLLLLSSLFVSHYINSFIHRSSARRFIHHSFLSVSLLVNTSLYI